MTHREETQLLAALHRGATSRNREFERFRDPRARRVLRVHRRLHSLFAEIQRPDVQVTACWSGDCCTLSVECRQPRLRYRRRLTLTRWEAAFLLQTPAGTDLAPLAIPPA
jgi:hypothetical protein